MSGPIRTFEALEKAARALPPVTVAVVGAADADVLGGALAAVHAGVAHVRLVGDPARVAALLEAAGAHEDDTIQIIPAAGDAEAVARAVELVASGRASVLLKGMVSTGELLRGALAKSAGIRGPDDLVSDVCLVPNPFRPGKSLLGISDGALNVAPSLEQKRVLIRNGVRVMRALGHASPHVALLCASEKPDKAMPHTVEARQLADEAAAGAFGPCIVEGPISMDIATSAEAARHKGVKSRIAGTPDLFVTPTIEAGNLLAKGLYLACRLPVAHVITGTRIPILINSRNDSAEDRFRSILLAMVVAAHWDEAVAAETKPAADGCAAAPSQATAGAALGGDAGPVHVLALNPGATSTKVALYAGREPLWREEVAHPALPPGPVAAQLESRLAAVREMLARHDAQPGGESVLAAVVGRGGLLPSLAGGTYRIDDRMLADLERAERGEHASNLGGPLAAALASDHGVPAFIVDPVSVDEMRDEARLTGWPSLQRDSLSHALNLRAVARRVAAQLGEPMSELRLIGVHMGTGISMAAFEHGRMVDVVNPREEGPLSADRAGALPAIAFGKLVLREGWTAKDVEKRLGREGGLQALLGTRDLREVRRRAAAGETECKTALDALVLSVAKYALGLVASLDGAPDRFFITGGMAHDTELMAALRVRLERVAEVAVHPGEDEIAALVEGALRAVSGEESAKSYADTVGTASGRHHG